MMGDGLRARLAFRKYPTPHLDTSPAGFNFVWCCLGERVAGGLSLRIQQLDVRCETKTKVGGAMGAGSRAQSPCDQAAAHLIHLIAGQRVRGCRGVCPVPGKKGGGGYLVCEVYEVARLHLSLPRPSCCRCASWAAPAACATYVVFMSQVVRESLYDAFYKLTDSRSQITSYVFDEVRP